MTAASLSIRVDLASGLRIGPGKIMLLEAIRSTGSISAAARSLGMSYRRAWLLVEDLNNGLREPVVTTESGGRRGGGATLTTVGGRVIELYREIESQASSSASRQFHALGTMARGEKINVARTKF
jgi:molybdate transport system regulatory protein